METLAVGCVVLIVVGSYAIRTMEVSDIFFSPYVRKALQSDVLQDVPANSFPLFRPHDNGRAVMDPSV